MKLEILQEKLKKGINIVERVTSKSLSLPILNNILLSTEKNFLSLSGTDLEIGIIWQTLAKIEKQGKITVPARLFSNFINLLPNKKIELKTENNNLEIIYENYKNQIKGVSAEEFPIIPKIKNDQFVLVDARLFCRNLSQITDIPVLSTTRPEISGIYLSFQDNLITAVATDSFRLGEKKISLKKENKFKKNYSLIVPQKTIKEITNIFSETEGDLKIYFSSNQVMFEYYSEEIKNNEIQVVSRLIEGEYPNYKEIIPCTYKTQIILNRDDFLNHIKTASLFSGKINEIKLKINPSKKEIEVFSESPDLGRHQSFLPAKIKGEKTDISFNYRFLIDGISQIRSAEVVFELNGDSGPAVLKPVGDDSYLYVVMPIKNE